MASMVDASAQAIAEALAPSPSVPAARWRWGTVVSVGNSGTMNVSIGGATVAGIRCAQHVMGAQVGDRVRVLYCGTEAIVDAVRASSRLMELPAISTEVVTVAGNIDRDGSAPATGQYSKIVGVQDKDGENVAYLQASQLTDGTVRAGLLAAGEDGNGNAVYNGIFTTVASDGTRGYTVSDSAAFRNAVNAAAVSDQSAQKVAFAAGSGTAQVQTIGFNVANTGHALSGKRLALLFRSDGIDLYNSTDSSYLWQYRTTQWAYLVGSESTIASGNFVRWCCKAGIVFVQVMYRSSAGLSTAEKNVGTIPSGYRPDANTETAAYLGGGNDHIGTIWVETSGAVKLAATASASTIYGMLSYPL